MLPNRLAAIQHILATVFTAQNALRALAPEFRWTGLGNLLGDFGECLAIDAYGLLKAPPGSTAFDATNSSGQTVQIKTNFSSSTIGFRGEADLLLVIRVSENGQWEELYFGDFATVAAASSYSARDNKRSITIAKLRTMATTPAQPAKILADPPVVTPQLSFTEVDDL